MSLIEIRRSPDRTFLRRFAIALIVFCTALGAERGFVRGMWTTAWIVWGVGGTVGLSGLVCPPVARLVYRSWMLLLFPVAVVLSYVVLGFVYYAVLTPIALVHRLCGGDPLERRFDRDAPSYWRPRSGERSVERSFRQF
jgi:hypothetical protein